MEGLRQTTRIHAEWGHETVVASCDTDQTPKKPDDHFELIPLGPGQYGWAYSPRLRSWLIGNLSTFDLAVMHGLWLYPSWALARIYDNRKALHEGLPPWFVFSHGMLDPWFQNWKRRPIKTLRNLLYWKAFESRTIRAADGVLFTSSEERRLAEIPFKPYTPQRQIVLPYGTSTPPSPTQKQGASFHSHLNGLNDRPYLLFLSRLHEKKAVDLLLHAYAAIKADKTSGSPPLPALVIAGPGLASDYGLLLQNLVSMLDLGDDVFFTGMLEGEAKWGAYYGAEAFVLPSHQENFGIAVAEALACAKPVLISNKVNIWKEIDNAGAGFVDADTEDGIENILLRWLRTPADERVSMSRKAVALFRKQYHVEASAKALLELAAST